MGGHPSRPVVAGGLERSTRRLGRAALERLRRTAADRRPFSTLLRVGFTEPHRSPGALVVSYTTVSPSPALSPKRHRWRSVLCGTVPRVTPGRCWRPPCPVEPGRSSATGSPPPTRPPGRLVRRAPSLGTSPPWTDAPPGSSWNRLQAVRRGSLDGDTPMRVTTRARQPGDSPIGPVPRCHRFITPLGSLRPAGRHLLHPGEPRRMPPSRSSLRAGDPPHHWGESRPPSPARGRVGRIPARTRQLTR